VIVIQDGDLKMGRKLKYDSRLYKVLKESLENLCNFEVISLDEYKALKRKLEDLQYGS